MILRRTVTTAEDQGVTYARANVWTDKGYCSKTFLSFSEANNWIPTTERVKK